MDEELNYIIDSLINAESTREKNSIFENSFNRSDNVKIFLFDEEYSNIDDSFKNKDVNGYRIFGPTDYTKMWVLDSKHIGKISRELKIGKVVHFDLNILTYLNKYINNYKQSVDISQFIEYLKYIKNNQFDYNISTAIMERSTSAISGDGKDIWSEIILSYVKFSNANFDTIEPNISLLSESEYGWAKKIYDSLLESEKHQFVQYTALCCLLLKAFLIKQDKKIENKLDALLQYSLDVLNVYLELETVLIHYYFESDNSIEKTFKKIQGYSKKTVDRILNTAWDIFHIRLMEFSLMIDNKDKEEIFLSYFSSRDDAFNELAKINRIKMFVIYEGMSFAIRDKGIRDICTNKDLLYKIESETGKRKTNISKVDFENEKNKLINEISNKQKLFFDHTI